MKLNILGEQYNYRLETTRTENILKDADGECRWYDKEIIIDKELTPVAHKNVVIRHEIIHAFLAESGLRRYREDEDIVNWIAWNFDKLKETFDLVLESEE